MDNCIDIESSPEGKDSQRVRELESEGARVQVKKDPESEEPAKVEKADTISRKSKSQRSSTCARGAEKKAKTEENGTGQSQATQMLESFTRKIVDMYGEDPHPCTPSSNHSQSTQRSTCLTTRLQYLSRYKDTHIRSRYHLGPGPWGGFAPPDTPESWGASSPRPPEFWGSFAPQTP